MSFNTDPELLQDFLVEAGELLDGLDEQLVELERSPDDHDLLNAVFRAFHTIKGGAGFLELHPIVEVCHRAEDVFNLLRNGQRRVDAQLMDVMLRVLDTLKSMFAELNEGRAPAQPDPALLHDLEALMSPPEAASAEPAAPPEEAGVAPESQPPAAAAEGQGGQEATPSGGQAPAAEGEAGQQAVQGSQQAPQEGGSEDIISDEEFEKLLDNLYGPGHGPSSAVVAKEEGASPAPAREEEIKEEEFEKLLDTLYGQGKGPSSEGVAPPAQVAPQPPAPPAQVAPQPPAPPAQVAPQPPAPQPPAPQPSAPQPSAPQPSAPQPSAPQPQAPQPQAPQPQAPQPQAPQPQAPQPQAPQPPADPVKNPVLEKGETTVRVDTERLDAIMNLVGELVLVRNRLNTLKSELKDERTAQAIATLDMVTSDLQAAVMKTRMQPIKKVFGRFPRVVRDMARTLGKEVELVLEGEDTDLDKNLVEALADPLVHLVRNAVDHGIEKPEVRVAHGKPRVGTVVLSAAQEGEHILLTVRDDGAGMDPEKLRRKAVEKGLLDAETAARLSPGECFELIFLPGFSTKEQISDISGRGVGMDVVKTAITKLSGSVSIDSTPGKGTVISIKIPLTLAILPTLMVVVNERKYAMPLGNVNEIFEMKGKPTHVVDGQRTITVRDRALPLFDLRQWLAIPGETPICDESEAQVIILQVGNQTVGLIVDSVLGQEEVVIKPLGELLHGLAGFAGATITGDGHIALIFDLAGLIKKYAHRGRERLAA